jgi:1A family penicillin-binding protein
MAKRGRKKLQTRPALSKILLSMFFNIVFHVIRFFVIVGEFTKKIILSPVYFLKKAIQSLASGVAALQNSIGRLFHRPQPDQKKVYLKHKKETKLATMTSPKASIQEEEGKKRSFRLPHFTIPFLPKRHRRVGRPTKNKYTLPRFTFFFIRQVGRFIILLTYFSIKLILKFLVFVLNIIGKFFYILFFIFIKKPWEFIAPIFTVKVRFFLLGLALCALFFIGRELHQFIVNLPSPKEIGKVNYSLSTHLYDRNGKLLYEIYRDQNRTPIKLSELPKYVPEATIAIEDKDFYSHKGISLVSGILRAANQTLFKGSLQGGSTITQQLVKNALLTPERTLDRKIKEIILALWTEQTYTKNQILEMYLNQVSYGSASYGIEEAAQSYFGKHANELSISEAALLAGLPQAPSEYSPFVNPKYALERRNDVLLNMRAQHYITDSEYQAAKTAPLTIIKQQTPIKAPHFVFYEKAELEKKYGTRMVEEGGLNVTTTLDLDVQEAVEKILKDGIDKQRYLNVTNGAVMITKPKTGEIVAMVGSVDYFQEPFGAFNVTTAERQPGSSLKPLLYSLALQKGFTAASIIPDTPSTFNVPGAAPYTPLNYDNRFHGNTTMRLALANSYNIPAVRTLYNVGIESFVNYMQRLGITTWNDPGRYVLPMALGGVEVRMVDLVAAYGTLANQGNHVNLSGTEKIVDSNDQVLEQLSPQKDQVMPEGAAYIITDILSDNQARTLTFGPGSQLEIPGYKVAVKTGTTDSKKDNWAIGYTPEYLVAVWIGNNDSTPMNPSIESGATGASSIWHEIMLYMLKNEATQPNEWYPRPADVVEKSCGGRTEYFLTGTENSVNCNPIPTPAPQQKPLQQGEQRQPQYNLTPTAAPVKENGRGNGNGNNRYNR